MRFYSGHSTLNERKVGELQISVPNCKAATPVQVIHTKENNRMDLLHWFGTAYCRATLRETFFPYLGTEWNGSTQQQNVGAANTTAIPERDLIKISKER